jgi:hypothetical protein
VDAVLEQRIPGRIAVGAAGAEPSPDASSVGHEIRAGWVSVGEGPDVGPVTELLGPIGVPTSDTGAGGLPTGTTVSDALVDLATLDALVAPS